jgi:hypothetical protein
MRLTILALFLLTGPMALCQSPTNSKPPQLQLSTQPWTDFSKLPPSLLATPATPYPKFSWHGGQPIGVEPSIKGFLVQNDRVPAPVDLWPFAKIEPIPTQWPDVTVEAIPSQWSNLNFLPITPDSHLPAMRQAPPYNGLK